MRPKHLLLIACISLLLTVPVAADVSGIPEIPIQLYGTLYNNEGQPIPAGTVLTAEVNGVLSTYTITEAGKIGGAGTFDDKFLIAGVSAGDQITFGIEGTTVKVTQTYNPKTQKDVQEIQITLPIDIKDLTPSTGSGGAGGTATQPPASTGTNSPQPSIQPPDSVPTEIPPTETAPTETLPPSQPQTPIQTTPPKSPGFGVLAVLAGLGAVAVLEHRRE